MESFNITINTFVPFLQIWLGTCLVLFYQGVQKKVLFNKNKIRSTQNGYLDIEKIIINLGFQYQGLLDEDLHFDYYHFFLNRYKRIIFTSFIYGTFILICAGFENSNNEILYTVLFIMDIFVFIYTIGCIVRYNYFKKPWITILFFLLSIICIITILFLKSKQIVDITFIKTTCYVPIITIFTCVFSLLSIYIISIYDNLIMKRLKRRIQNLNDTISWCFNHQLLLDGNTNDIPKKYRKRIVKIINRNPSIGMNIFTDLFTSILSSEFKKIKKLWNINSNEENEESEDVFSDAQIRQLKRLLNEHLSKNHQKTNY